MTEDSTDGSAPAPASTIMTTTTTETAAAPVYIMDPYLEFINPGMSKGAKLFNKATKERETKISVSQKNAKEIHLQFFWKQENLVGVRSLGKYQLMVLGIN